MTKNNQEPKAEPMQDRLQDTKELPKIYVQKPVMISKKPMSKFEKAFHISLISIYFIMLSVISVMRFGFHYDIRPLDEYSESCRKDLFGCNYPENDIYFAIDVLSLIVCISSFIYASFLRQKEIKNIRIISKVIKVSATIYICTIRFMSIFIIPLSLLVLVFALEWRKQKGRRLITKNNQQQPQAEPTQEPLHDTKELPRFYVQKPVMTSEKPMSKFEKTFHVSLISIYFIMLSVISVMRFGFHCSFDPDPREQPYNHDDICDRDSQFTIMGCTYHHRPNDFTFDVVLLLIGILVLVYAYFLYKEKMRKFKIVPVMMTLSTILYLSTVSLVKYAFLAVFLTILAMVLAFFESIFW
ncbi:MAG: hypothetical protein LBI63_00475 [Candidatus Ancillula sp.]|jgi:hypothetical protein|nr:hypothetical protein [Candidatus Ancillula sp.]